MKHLLIKSKFLILIFVFAFANSISAQSVSTTNQTFTGSDFGTTIEAPINTSDIHSSYGNISIATIRVEFDTNIIVYTGYTNLHASIASNATITVFPAGANGIVQFNVEANDFFGGFAWPDGKAWDMQFTYKGAYSLLDITLAEFLPSSTFVAVYPPTTNGSVTGYADIAATDGDWHTTSIWSPAGNMGSLTEPGPGHNVTINPGGTVTVNTADGLCNDLTIGTGSNGNLTLGAFTLEVLGDFLIESTATGTGSFINNGTLDVTGTKGAERYIAGYAGGDLDGWHLLSSPVASQGISDGDQWRPASGYDFYRWKETTQMWENIKVHNWGSFTVGKGYLVAYVAADTKVFSGGAFNKNDVSGITITNSGADPQGFNLLGNPYPSALTWYDGWTFSGSVATYAKIWKETSASYVDIAQGGAIPANNGIMVYSIDATQTVTIPASARIHSGTAWYKSGDQQIKLLARDLDQDVYQESVVRFDENANEGYDPELDSRFLMGYAPAFYSFADDVMISTNSMPWNVDLVVPFMFETNGSSNFAIELGETIEGHDVYLKDLKEDVTVNLTEINSYAFTYETGDDPARFEIMFGVVGIDDPEALAAALVYSNDNKIIVANVIGDTEMSVLNISGQMVYNTSFNSTGLTEVAVDLPSGIYMVRLTHDGAVKTSKVFVK